MRHELYAQRGNLASKLNILQLSVLELEVRTGRSDRHTDCENCAIITGVLNFEAREHRALAETNNKLVA